MMDPYSRTEPQPQSTPDPQPANQPKRRDWMAPLRDSPMLGWIGMAAVVAVVVVGAFVFGG
jgi:hypothetical protein